MLTVFIVLAALGFAAAIGATVWWVVESGRIRTRSGPEVGAEIMAGLADPDEDRDQIGVAEVSRQRFKGTGVKVEGAAETSFAGLKQQIAGKRWREAAPPLVAAAGLLATILFGGLAALVGLENQLLGGIIAAISVYAVARMIRNFVRA